EAAAPKVLRAICESSGWVLGALWDSDEERGPLQCVALWCATPLGDFEAMTRELRFAPGVGLPGRVGAAREPAWLRDVVNDPNFPRAAVAAAAGLHAAAGFPIVVHRQILGVMEFFSTEEREPDTDLLSMMSHLGVQFGQFAERTRARQALQ